MRIFFQNNFSEKFVSNVLSITSVLFAFHYIVFSIIKRFGENQKLFVIPLSLVLANFLILVEMIYIIKSNKAVSSKKQFYRLMLEIFMNLCFLILIVSYLI